MGARNQKRLARYPDAYLAALASGRFTHLIGIDECGYGSLAGPLMVCGAAAPVGWRLDKLRDSKKVSAGNRDVLFEKLHDVLEYVPILTSSTEIDRRGVRTVLLESFETAAKKLLVHYPNALVVIDGDISIDRTVAQVHFPKADDLVPAVSAASVLGKVLRDRLMHQMHHQFPHYQWNLNVGYGTPAHIDAIHMFGPCELHRRSYEPVRTLTGFKG